MGTPAPGRSARPATLFTLTRRIGRGITAPFAKIGQWVVFTGQVLISLPLTARHYTKETLARMNGLAWGRGAIFSDGGVISVLTIMGIAIGASIAIEAFATLNLLGMGALSGIVGGLANVREFAPLITSIAFAAQVGCRMTAEIGSMRISEEIDAIEAMGLRPIPFVVGTRFIGGMLIVVPGFLLTLMMGFFIANVMVKLVYGQPAGTYDHYFVQFLTPADLAYSTLKAAVFCAAVIVIHCYYGYFATGGPEGVGLASGRAVRMSLVVMMALDFVMTIVLWGLSPTFIFKG